MSLAGKLIFLSIGWIAVATCGAGGLSFVDPMIGTEGDGSEYGGMIPYTCVPFGSFHLVPMTRTNRIGRVTLNGKDLSSWRVSHHELTKGGELAFEMFPFSCKTTERIK